jgi:ERCC4-type nuclease
MASQEKMEAAVSVIPFAQVKSEETINEQVEVILMSINQSTQGLCEELLSKIQVMKMLVESTLHG